MRKAQRGGCERRPGGGQCQNLQHHGKDYDLVIRARVAVSGSYARSGIIQFALKVSLAAGWRRREEGKTPSRRDRRPGQETGCMVEVVTCTRKPKEHFRAILNSLPEEDSLETSA